MRARRRGNAAGGGKRWEAGHGVLRWSKLTGTAERACKGRSQGVRPGAGEREGRHGAVRGRVREQSSRRGGGGGAEPWGSSDLRRGGRERAAERGEEAEGLTGVRRVWGVGVEEETATMS